MGLEYEQEIAPLKSIRIEESGWLSRLSVRLWMSAQVVGSSPGSGSVLTGQSLRGILSLPLSSLLRMRTLSLSLQINTLKKQKEIDTCQSKSHFLLYLALTCDTYIDSMWDLI